MADSKRLDKRKNMFLKADIAKKYEDMKLGDKKVMPAGKGMVK